MKRTSCMNTIRVPENWQIIVDFVESTRENFTEIKAYNKDCFPLITLLFADGSA